VVVRNLILSNRVYSIADNHAQTVQVCIDRLHELGANQQLKVLTGRLQKLAIRVERGDVTKEFRPALDTEGPEGTTEPVALTAPDPLSQRRYCRG
jgi:hypothetical protein